MRRKSGQRGFSTIELFMVMGVALILISIITISAVGLVQGARGENALKQISAVLRATRQAALTTNQPRRLVLRATYSGSASTHKEAFDLNPTFDFWVERKQIRNRGWEANFSEPLDDVQNLPGGVTLIDINGVGILPQNLSLGRQNDDGTRSFFTSLVFNNRGSLDEVQWENRPLSGGGFFKTERPIQQNLALHFMLEGTEIDLSEANPASEAIDYIEMIKFPTEGSNPEFSPPVGVNQTLIVIRNQSIADPQNDQEIVSRTQIQTLYVLHLTGQSVPYDYGIFPPWPIQPMNAQLGGPTS